MPGLFISQWGPAGWNILHAMAHTVPDSLSAQERVRLRRFLLDFAHYLPCRICSKHFAEFVRVRATDNVLSTRKGVVRFLFDAHNGVNIRNGKRKLSMDEYHRMYTLSARSSAAVPLLLSVCTALCLYAVGARAARRVAVVRLL
jgi:hypothetical protein